MSARTYIADRLIDGGHARAIEVRGGNLVYVSFVNGREAALRIERDDYQVWCADDGFVELARRIFDNNVPPDEHDVLHLTEDQCWTLLSSWAGRRTRRRPYWV